MSQSDRPDYGAQGWTQSEDRCKDCGQFECYCPATERVAAAITRHFLGPGAIVTENERTVARVALRAILAAGWQPPRTDVPRECPPPETFNVADTPDPQPGWHYETRTRLGSPMVERVYTHPDPDHPAGGQVSVLGRTAPPGSAPA